MFSSLDLSGSLSEISLHKNQGKRMKGVRKDATQEQQRLNKDTTSARRRLEYAVAARLTGGI